MPRRFFSCSTLAQHWARAFMVGSSADEPSGGSSAGAEKDEGKNDEIEEVVSLLPGILPPAQAASIRHTRSVAIRRIMSGTGSRRYARRSGRADAGLYDQPVNETLPM